MASILDDFLQYGSGSAPASLGTAVPDAGQRPIDAVLSQIIQPTQDNTVSPLVVPAPQQQQPQPLDYDNSSQVKAVEQAVRPTSGAPDLSGGDNPGAWGMLPHFVQHGTLRNVLGAIGDAFLMHAGHDPMYENRMQNREIGAAMAGYAQNPQAAIERVAATGAPGATKMAQSLEEQYQNMQMRKEIAQQNLDYRQQNFQQNSLYHQSLIQSRNESIIQRMMPYIGGMIQGAKTPADYNAIYSRADTMAKRIDPNLDATTAFGVPAPQDWKPGMTGTAGMTGGQIAHEQVSRESIAERANAAGMAHSDRMYHYTHPSAGRQPTTASMISGIEAKVNAGQPLQPGEQAVWNRYLNGTKGGAASHLHLSGQNAPGPQHFTHTATGPNGVKVGWNGSHWVDVRTGKPVQ